MKTTAVTAAEQLRRLLLLIPHLADGDEHKVDDVAAIVGVEPGEVVDDLNSLVQRFDLPGGFVEGVQLYYEGDTVSVSTPHFLRPMRLTMAELCALELGLAILRTERSGAELAPIERALARLRNVITKVPDTDPGNDLLAGALPAGQSTRHLSALRHAVRHRRKARILYMKGAATRAESRVVCPYALVFASGAWYVVAHCERESALRVFRVDRISEVAEEEESYEMPEDFSVEGALARSKALMSQPAEETLRVRYSPRIAKWIAEREGVAVDDDGSVTVEYPLHDDAWAMRHVLQYGAEAELISPDRVRRSIADRLAGAGEA
jgi:proteasome accessory factor C